MKGSVLLVGTRASPLALAQTKIVIELLKKKNKDSNFKVRKISTEGDVNPGSGKDSFTKAIDVALESSDIDIAVHSLKDVPVDSSSIGKIEIAAFPKRDSPYDVFIPNRKGETLHTLPRFAKVGTSSKRRSIQLKTIRPDLQIIELHGNIQTRIKKLRNGSLDGIILARAGLKRLGLSRLGYTIPKELMLPAPGQGCLAVVARKGDQSTKSLVARIDDANTRCAVSAERAFSETLGGGCNMPIAALATVHEKRIVIDGLVESANSSSLVARSKIEGPSSDATILGRKLALELKRFTKKG